MNRIRGKLNQFQEDIRKESRQKMMAEQRVWKEMPSVIVQLPYRIDHSDWTYIEELLDSIAEQDIAILDKALTAYIEAKYNAQFDHPSPKEWQNPLKFNILRIVVRLRLAKDYHISKLLKLLEDANQSLNKQFSISAFQVLLKLIKELAIFLQITEETNQENSLIWSENNCRLMNLICSNLQIYRFRSLENSQYASLLNSYHLYYVYLIADRRIDFKQYLTTKNVDQIYQLIDRSHESADSLQISKSIDIINKIIICLNYQDKDTSVLLHSLQILLINGYDSCKKYTSNLSNPRPIQTDLDFTGTFFSKLLSLASNTDILTVIKIIQHLAKLIELSDHFIKAIFSVHLPNETCHKTDSKHGSQETHVIILRPKQFLTYTEFISFQMQNLLCEVRYKAYWLISNILGSDKYFSEYGLQFLQQVYCKNYLQLQRGNINIQNEIYFCILNYFCNIRNRTHITDLMTLAPIPSHGTNAKQSTRNSFYFFVDVLINMVEKLAETLRNEGLAFYHGKEDIFMHRIIYSIYNLLKVVQEEDRIEDLNYQTLMNTMEKNKVGLYMDQIFEKIQASTHISSQIQSLLELILKLFSNHENQHKLL